MPRPEKKDSFARKVFYWRDNSKLKLIVAIDKAHNQALDECFKWFKEEVIDEEEITKILVEVNKQTIREGKEQEISREEPYVYKLSKVIADYLRGKI